MSHIQQFQELYLLTDAQMKILSTQPLHCKCGAFRKIKQASYASAGVVLSLYCGRKECHPRFGIKRPEHSQYMKQLAATGTNELYSNSLIKPGELRNPNINTDLFREQILKKYYPNEESFSSMLSGRVKSVKWRRSQIIIKFTKWETYYQTLVNTLVGTEITPEYVLSLSDDEVHKVWSKIHSVNSIRNLDNSKNTGRNSWFKSELLVNLVYNQQGLTAVRTRSGLETWYINLFEKEKINWSYEKYKIPTIDKTGYYTPDFVVEYNNATYMIETKGSFFRCDKDEYIRNKIQAGVKFANSQGWRFCLVFTKSKDMSFLEKTIIGE
jgi:hypothetical protein